MTKNLTISALLTIPTLAGNGRFQLTVGIQLSDGQRFWADCIDASAASRTGETAVFDLSQARSVVQQVVQPLWQGQPAKAFRPLAQLLTGATESFTYQRTHLATPQTAPGGLSRRSLITGFMAEEAQPSEPQQEAVTIERPLHPALQYGLTTALFQAAASINRLTMAELIVAEYGLPKVDTAVPLLIPLNDGSIQTAQPILTSHVAALGYTTSKHNHKATLGANAARLQQHIRQVAAWLPTLNDVFNPVLQLNLNGGFGTLFENNIGKILGALYGLERAAQPYRLQVQNPVWLESRDAQRDYLKQLKNYLALRQMKLQLVADAWVDSVDDVKLLSDPELCHMVHIDLPRLGNLEWGITAVLHALAHKQQVLLSGENAPLTSHIGLATRPTLLSGSPQLHYNTMQQLLPA